MAEYNSTHTGAQIDEAVDKVLGSSSYTALQTQINNITNGTTAVGKIKPVASTESIMVAGFLDGITSGSANTINYNSTVKITGSKIYSAAWNDFAEYRYVDKDYEPGSIVRERLNGIMTQPYGRLVGGCAVVSDTYGVCIGREAENSVPIAVAGRVLVKYTDDLNEYNAGDAVCGAPDGISKMTREEIKEYPDRILGYISEIPTYDTWEDIEVGDRIWVRLK